MVTNAERIELLDALDRLDDARRRELMDHVRKLIQQSPVQDESDSALSDLAGSIPPDVADDWERVIEEHCERIDSEAWR